jgi:type II secretory pathway component GspD/PulD (secretin)
MSSHVFKVCHVLLAWALLFGAAIPAQAQTSRGGSIASPSLTEEQDQQTQDAEFPIPPAVRLEIEQAAAAEQDKAGDEDAAGAGEAGDTAGDPNEETTGTPQDMETTEPDLATEPPQSVALPDTAEQPVTFGQGNLDAPPIIYQATPSATPSATPQEAQQTIPLTPVGPPVATGAPGAGTSAGVDNFFYETDIRQAAAELSQQGGKRVIVAPEVEGVVTMSFSGVPLKEALELLVAGTGYLLIEAPDYFLIVSPQVESTSFLEISETRLISLDYLKAATARTLLPKALQEYVAADEERNLLSVSAPSQVLDRILKDLAVLDAAPRQMVLQTRIVVMESEDVMNLGFEWEGPTATAGAFSNSGLHGALAPLNAPAWPWAIQAGLTPAQEFTNALNVRLNMMATTDQITVLANLHVLALDGEEAEVSVTTEEYFEILTQGFYTQSQLEQVEAGTILKMTPRVSENGDIKLTISTEVSDVVSRRNNDLPVVTRRLASSSVRVHDGGTVVVAGLTDDRNRNNHQKVPGLGDVPLLSSAFRNTGRDRRKRQILVFVTPRLMKTGEPGEELISRKNIAPVDEDVFRQELIESLERLRLRKAHPTGSAVVVVPEPPAVIEAPCIAEGELAPVAPPVVIAPAAPPAPAARQTLEPERLSQAGNRGQLFRRTTAEAVDETAVMSAGALAATERLTADREADFR